MSQIVNKRLKININGEESISVKYKTKVDDILKQILSGEDYARLLGVRVNNEVKTLDFEVVDNISLEPIYYESHDGYRIYTRTVKFLLYMALKRCFPKLKVELCNTIDNNSYFICDNYEFTADMAQELLKEMRSIVARNSEINRRVVSYDEARALYAFINDTEKTRGLDIKISSYLTLYFSEDLFGTMYGVLAPSAGRTPEFNIKKFREGFVLIFPNPEDMNDVEKNVKDNVIYSVYEETNKHLNMMDMRNISDLNNKIIKCEISDTIKISESIHAQKMVELINVIKEREKLKVIFIAGPSSSGKTTFAGKLGVNLRLIGYNPVVISMDNYFKERSETPLQENGEYDFETIDALDLNLFNKDMANLIKGKEVELPEFDFFVGQKKYNGNRVKLKENDVIILEGIHALNPVIMEKVPEDVKFKIYIAPMTTLNIDEFSKVSTTDTRMLRRIVRDYRTRGHSVERTLELWANIMKGEGKYIYPYIKEADYIFNTSLPYELAILKTYAEPLLFQIDSSSKYFSETRRLYNLLSNYIVTASNDVPDESILREFIGEK